MQMAVSIFLVVISVLAIFVVMIQESPRGASGALTGSADLDSHYDKIKGRTGGAILKKLTVALAILLALALYAVNLLG